MRKHLELHVFVSVILWFTGLEDTTFFGADVAMSIFYILEYTLLVCGAGDDYVGTCYVGPRTQYCPSHLPSSAHPRPMAHGRTFCLNVTCSVAMFYCPVGHYLHLEPF